MTTTPPIQYALESLPELLCASDYKLLCNAIGLSYLPHRDDLRNHIEHIIERRDKHTLNLRQELEMKAQREYEMSLVADADGFYPWDGWLYPRGPTAEMLGMPESPDYVPIFEPLDIIIKVGAGLATISHQIVNWSCVKHWKVAK